MINVLLPSLIKSNFPTKIGIMTGIYTTAMSIFAATASGLSVPLTTNLGLGWKWALASWSILTVAGIIVWSITIKATPRSPEQQLVEPSRGRLMRSGIAWQVTLFMGLQSFLFYATISWLAEILISQGYTASSAGWYVAYMQFIGLPATFFTPVLAGKFQNQQAIVACVTFLGLVGYGLLYFEPGTIVITIAITFIGTMLGACISLSLTLLSLRTTTAKQAAELSGMAQSFGYLLAALGPISIGFIFDLTSSWHPPIVTIVFIVLAVAVFGLGAGRNKNALSD
ncbi:hypothetical protein GCM10026983_35150 [Gracilibacillus alcaliphilus]